MSKFTIETTTDNTNLVCDKEQLLMLLDGVEQKFDSPEVAGVLTEEVAKLGGRLHMAMSGALVAAAKERLWEEWDFSPCAGGGDPEISQPHEQDQGAWNAYLLLEKVPWYKVIALAEPRGAEEIRLDVERIIQSSEEKFFYDPAGRIFELYDRLYQLIGEAWMAALKEGREFDPAPFEGIEALWVMETQLEDGWEMDEYHRKWTNHVNHWFTDTTPVVFPFMMKAHPGERDTRDLGWTQPGDSILDHKDMRLIAQFMESFIELKELESDYQFQKHSCSELSVIELKDSLLVLEQKVAELIDRLVSKGLDVPWHKKMLVGYQHQLVYVGDD